MELSAFTIDGSEVDGADLLVTMRVPAQLAARLAEQCETNDPALDDDALSDVGARVVAALVLV